MLKIVKKYSIIIITLASLALLASNFGDDNKLIFLIKPTISFYDFI
jgi:hypothetical protein